MSYTNIDIKQQLKRNASISTHQIIKHDPQRINNKTTANDEPSKGISFPLTM